MKRLIAVACLAGMVFTLSGCIGYYRIKDPQSGATYYTREWQKEGDHKEQTRFRDKISGKVCLLTDAEIEKISKKDYEAAVH